VIYGDKDPVSHERERGFVFCLINFIDAIDFRSIRSIYIFEDRSNWAATMNGSFASGSDRKIPIMGAVNLNG
jgi:hypothetical protein